MTALRQWLGNSSVLAGLNSLTKFPSIPTLHVLGERGRLGSTLDPGLRLGELEYVATEKVDGTNARALLLPDGSFLFGSREELLWYSGDVVYNPALGIVETLRSEFGVDSDGTSDRLAEVVLRWFSGFVVLYLEVYGHGVGKAGAQYATKGWTGARLIDAAFWPGHSWLRKVCDSSVEVIARERDAGATPFLSWAGVVDLGGKTDLDAVPEEPFPPLGDPSHEAVLRYLEARGPSGVRLDEDAPGRKEGVVLRSTNGNASGGSPVHRVKLRREDYERTVRARRSDCLSRLRSEGASKDDG